MKPIDYLTDEEKFVLKTIKRDINYCKSVRDLKRLENKLDILLKRSIKRYKHKKRLG